MSGALQPWNHYAVKFGLMHKGTTLLKECVTFACLLKIPQLLQIAIQTNSLLKNIMISLP